MWHTCNYSLVTRCSRVSLSKYHSRTAISAPVKVSQLKNLVKVFPYRRTSGEQPVVSDLDLIFCVKFCVHFWMIPQSFQPCHNGVWLETMVVNHHSWAELMIYFFFLGLCQNFWGARGLQNLYGCHPPVTHQKGTAIQNSTSSLLLPYRKYSCRLFLNICPQGSFLLSQKSGDETYALHMKAFSCGVTVKLDLALSEF